MLEVRALSCGPPPQAFALTGHRGWTSSGVHLVGWYCACLGTLMVFYASLVIGDPCKLSHGFTQGISLISYADNYMLCK